MKLVICSIYDRAAGAYNRPFFAPAEGLALRSFRDEVNRAADGNEMHRHPADFDLYVFGVFDDNSGQFTLTETPRLVVNANSVSERAALLKA